MQAKQVMLQFGLTGWVDTPVAGDSYVAIRANESSEVDITQIRGDASITVNLAAGEIFYAPISTWSVTSGAVLALKADAK